MNIMGPRLGMAVSIVALLMAPIGLATVGGLQPLAQRSLAEPTYLAWMLIVPAGSALQLNVSATIRDGDMQGFGLVMWDVNRPRDSLHYLWGAASFSTARIHMQSRGFGPVSMAANVGCEYLTIIGECTAEESLIVNADEVPAASAWSVVVVTATDGGADRTDVTLSASPGVAIAGTSTGAAFLQREDGFQGKENVVVEAEVLTVQSIVSASSYHSFGSRLFGCFCGSADHGRVETSVQTPGGVLRDRLFYVFNGAEQGDYQFRIERESGISWSTKVWLVAADVVLP